MSDKFLDTFFVKLNPAYIFILDMNIVADTNIPFVEKAFSRFGKVRVVSGRAIDRSMVKDADILLVRSVTRADGNLLEGSSVGFVGTATIGTDHVDTRYLAEKGIAFASAPGSNARSVAEYVACAIVHVFQGDLALISGKTLGIVGAGNVGSRVIDLARGLGMRCLVNDPPLALKDGAEGFVPLDRVLAEADIVTLHVPLTPSGPYPTARLADASFLGRLKPGAMLINSSRGRVIDEKALLTLRSRLGPVVLDVWESEPSINPAMLERTDIATPHIAGYSFDGKVRGAQMLFDAAAAYLKSDASWSDAVGQTETEERLIDIRDAGRPLMEALETAYPIMEDDAAMRKIAQSADPGAYFDKLRKEYPKRLEFGHFTVRCSREQEGTVGLVLRNSGFRLIEN
jgi:erythronate-4-phosphate dehydrogenase